MLSFRHTLHIHQIIAQSLHSSFSRLLTVGAKHTLAYNKTVLTKTRNDLQQPTTSKKQPGMTCNDLQWARNDLQRPTTSKKPETTYNGQEMTWNDLQQARNDLKWPTWARSDMKWPVRTWKDLQQTKKQPGNDL